MEWTYIKYQIIGIAKHKLATTRQYEKFRKNFEGQRKYLNYILENKNFIKSKSGTNLYLLYTKCRSPMLASAGQCISRESEEIRLSH